MKQSKTGRLAGVMSLLASAAALVLPFVRQEEVLPAAVEPPIVLVHYRFLIGTLIEALIDREPCVLLVASQILICILLIAAGCLTLRNRSAKSRIVSAVGNAAATADLVCLLVFQENVFEALRSVSYGIYQYSFGFWAPLIAVCAALICCLSSLFSLSKAASAEPEKGE